jgi:hypothetical protein
MADRPSSSTRDRRDKHEKRDRPSRSRSPKKHKDRGGLRWKDSRKDRDTQGEEKVLERGYRTRSRSPKRQRNSVEDKFGVAAKFGTSAKEEEKGKEQEKGKEAEKTKENMPPKRVPAAAPTIAHGEPMIIVHVNDRLGNKAAIPCLASDPIKLFKAQVAARIGRQPHQILLKRQGERPFKDQLTLEDYGVSNGVQIDLEIDTGE